MVTSASRLWGLLATKMNVFRQRFILCFPHRSAHIKFLSSGVVAEEGVIKSPAPYLELPKGNFVDFLLQNSHKWPNLTALECLATGHKISYSQLIDQSRRWSGFLKNIGIGKGDVVSIISSNNPHFGPIFLGTTAIGAALSPINANFMPGEISKLLRNNKAKVLITVGEIEGAVDEALKEVQQTVRQFSIGDSKKGLPNIVDILNNDSLPFADPVELSGDEPLFLPFSSGTTGFPKAVALSHNAFIANTLQYLNSYHDLISRDSADGTQETFLAMLPFFHVYGSFVIFTIGIFKGFKIATMPRFDPDTFVAAIINQKLGFLHTVPTLLHFLLGRKELNASDMRNIHTVFCGAAPVLPSAAKMFCEKIGRDIFFIEGYGMTEVLLSHCSPRLQTRKRSSMQLLSNCEAKIVDPQSDKILSANEPGEIWMRTPSKMLYYLDNPQATAEIFREDGWFRSGDIGYYDDEEYFYIVDRLKDFIKVKGLQVSPTEIEDVLKTHPAVMESSVIGIPDERHGEVPKAFVVLKGKATETELQKLVEAKLSKHKHLAGGVIFVESLPKSETGKVLRRELRNIR